MLTCGYAVNLGALCAKLSGEFHKTQGAAMTTSTATFTPTPLCQPWCVEHEAHALCQSVVLPPQPSFLRGKNYVWPPKFSR